MVPIYSIDSFISFRFYRYGVYVDLVRDTYEAFVIYTFVTLLVEMLGGLEACLEKVQSKDMPIRLPFPLSRIKRIRIDPKTGGKKWLYRIKIGTLQYAYIRPITTCIAVVLQLLGVYCPGNITPIYGWFYITAITFVSVTVAMYCLIAFYSTMKLDLAPYKPLLKFLSIKFVIFLTFWQMVLVAGLVEIHLVKATTYWTADDVSTGIQNMLICIEMVIASIFHFFCFSANEFAEDGVKTPVWGSFLTVLNLGDVVKESHKHLVPKRIRGKTFGSKSTVELSGLSASNHASVSADNDKPIGVEINLQDVEVSEEKQV